MSAPIGADSGAFRRRRVLRFGAVRRLDHYAVTPPKTAQTKPRLSGRKGLHKLERLYDTPRRTPLPAPVSLRGDETDVPRISAHRTGCRPGSPIPPQADPRHARPARRSPRRPLDPAGRRRPGAHLRAHGPDRPVADTIVTTRTTGSGRSRKLTMRCHEVPIRGCGPLVRVAASALRAAPPRRGQGQDERKSPAPQPSRREKRSSCCQRGAARGEWAQAVAFSEKPLIIAGH